MNENVIINRYLKPLSKNFKEALNLSDDAAILRIFRNKNLVISVDNFIYGIHCPDYINISSAVNRAILAAISDLSANENLTFLMSDLDRLTKRFEDVIKDSKYICEIHSDCKVKLISNGNHNYFYLPQLTISQFFLILRAPFWKMTFLVRTYRQYNFIFFHFFK